METPLQEESERVRQGLLDYYKVAVDRQKLLTSLNAGALVLIGTFLSDIFSKSDLNLLLPIIGVPIGVFVVLSLLFFGISLLVCTWLIEMYNRAILRLTEHLTTRSEVSVRSGMGSVKQDFEQNERNSVRAGLRIAASICFLLGFATFGLAASVNLLSSLE